MMRLTLLWPITATCLLSACAQESPPTAAIPSESNTTSRPNLVIIVADDMGYTDIGAFGSEIRTPNLDGLAERSIRFTNFHALPTCAPTRAMLLSGTDHHTAGLGSMFGPRTLSGIGDREGYERYLHERVATLPEILADAGYHTYMAGKWHLGASPGQWPTDRGFEKAFSLLPGSGDHFTAGAGEYAENGMLLDSVPENFYSTRTHTDKLIEYIDSNHGDGQPFFVFAAYTSPHWPLQAPDDFVDRYAGAYDEGYDVLRERRLARAQELGVLPDLDIGDDFQRTGTSWDELDADAQRHYARRMEIYAAMVENLDHHVGRLTAHLEQIGELENTIILFMSDNGAESDEMELNPTFAERIRRNQADNSLENIGHPGSFISYGPGWAQASTAGFSRFKGFINEGGWRVPAFILHAGGTNPTGLDGQYLSAMDIAPTLLELAGANPPQSPYRGRAVAPMTGRSFAGVLMGDDGPVYGADEPIAVELHGGRAVRLGDYKLVWEQPAANSWWGYPLHDTWYRWQLFNLATDPREAHDLAAEQPELLAELTAHWEDYADTHNVARDVRIVNFERWQYPPPAEN